MRLWSWLIKYGQFLLDQVYNTGQVTCTRGSATVIGTNTAWTSELVDHQFRVGIQAPIYTISSVQSATQLTLQYPWGWPSITNLNYEIYNAYVSVPSDFLSFVSILDPRYNWQLNFNYSLMEIDRVDAQRSNRGNAYAVIARDYYTPNGATLPLPRYEMWPHQRAQYVYPYLYVSRPIDISDPASTLPQYIRGDVLLAMALAECARWPGTEDKKNPMFSIPLASMYDKQVDDLVSQLERQDDEIFENDTFYRMSQYPFAPYPILDSRWLQSHEFPAY
jgi:hypothetical protein